MTNKDQFKCARCGNCCLWEGYVRISENELDKIAAFLSMEPYDFAREYTRLCSDRRGLSLTENSDGSCIFYDRHAKLCMINEVKPKQCSEFPFTWDFPGWDNICMGSIRMRENESPSKNCHAE